MSDKKPGLFRRAVRLGVKKASNGLDNLEYGSPEEALAAAVEARLGDVRFARTELQNSLREQGVWARQIEVSTENLKKARDAINAAKARRDQAEQKLTEALEAGDDTSAAAHQAEIDQLDTWSGRIFAASEVEMEKLQQAETTVAAMQPSIDAMKQSLEQAQESHKSAVMEKATLINQKRAAESVARVREAQASLGGEGNDAATRHLERARQDVAEAVANADALNTMAADGTLGTPQLSIDQLTKALPGARTSLRDQESSLLDRFDRILPPAPTRALPSAPKESATRPVKAIEAAAVKPAKIPTKTPTKTPGAPEAEAPQQNSKAPAGQGVS